MTRCGHPVPHAPHQWMYKQELLGCDGGVVFGSECPFCGMVNDRVTSVTAGDTPEAGDPSICAGCGEIAVFTGSWLGKRKPTEAESVVFAADPVIRTVRDQVRGRAN